MIRTQIQLPDHLYKEVQRVAQDQEWSIAEVIRRGAEAITRAYPCIKQRTSHPWRLPPPIQSKVLIHEVSEMMDLVRGDEERAL